MNVTKISSHAKQPDKLPIQSTSSHQTILVRGHSSNKSKEMICCLLKVYLEFKNQSGVFLASSVYCLSQLQHRKQQASDSLLHMCPAFYEYYFSSKNNVTGCALFHPL